MIQFPLFYIVYCVTETWQSQTAAARGRELGLQKERTLFES